MRYQVEFSCGGQVASEGLFDNDTRMLSQLRDAKPSNHRLKKRGRNSEIVRRPPCLAQRIFDRCECAWVFVISAHILEQREKLIVDSTRTPDAVRHTLVQSNQTPFWKCDADDRNLKRAALDHRIERGKYLLMGKITRYTKNH